MARAITILVLLFSVTAYAQLSPEEAQKRLAERQAARQVEREKLVTIKQGDLDDLKAEIAKLKAEVMALKAKETTTVAAAPATAPSMVLRITKGVTRQQLLFFVSQHSDKYRITKDVRTPSKQEMITLEKFRIEKVNQGTRFTGTHTVDLVKDEKKATNTWELLLNSDVVSDITSADNVAIE